MEPKVLRRAWLKHWARRVVYRADLICRPAGFPQRCHSRRGSPSVHSLLGATTWRVTLAVGGWTDACWA
eukprot:1367906-Alexandrium_andersonii.AAC.1